MTAKKMSTQNNKCEILRLRTALLAGAQTELPILNEHVDGEGQARDDTCKQEDGDTVADAVFVDLFTQPHHERGACGKYQNDNDRGKYHGEALSVAGDGGVMQIEEVRCTLDQTQADRHITGDGADLLSACLALLGKSFQGRDRYAEKLDNNGAVDVGGDTHGKDGGVGERTTRQGVEVSDHVVAYVGRYAVGRRHCRLQRVGVDERYRNDRTDTEHHDDEQGEQELFAKIRDRPCVSDDFKQLDHLCLSARSLDCGFG